MLPYPGIAQSLNDAVPFLADALSAAGDGAVQYRFVVASLGMTYTLFRTNSKYGASATVNDAFTKARTVSAGVRFLKTSSAESESG